MTTAVDRQTTTQTVAQAQPAGAKPKRDARYLALRNFAISISVFNIFGYALLGFEQPYLWPILALVTGYVTDLSLETIAAKARRRATGYSGRGVRGFMEFLLPAHITALACNMLLYANNQYWPVMLAIIVAISGKYLLVAPIAGRMRHFMNPSNLGISATLLMLGSWVSIAPPYQFTEWASTYFKFMVPIIILTSGTVINAMLTRKMPLIVGWLGGFAIQAFLRHWIWHVQLNTALGIMTGVAFVLFTNYMITDPGTTPSKARAQFMFGSSIAFVYGALMVFNIVYTLFFAVCIVCASRGIGWWIASLRKRRTRDAAPAVSASGVRPAAASALTPSN